ncbi:hypothetical protein ACIBHX_44280 [Nonomuraea sp. NPDC050536]|uniref:hypothetical protein n=1 Tax=Nonomuraea sp. NPDC050536 TaxID=3364366 RepID=UPI0037CB384B
MTTPTETWRGSTMLRPGWLAFAGSVGTTDAHAHAAVQVPIVTAGHVELSDAHGTRRPFRTAVIPTRTPHAVHGDADAIATMLYLDSDSAPARRLADELSGAPRGRLDRRRP